MGVARPLSLLSRRQTDTLPRVTRVIEGSLQQDSARDWHRRKSLAFPEPGCLAAQSLQWVILFNTESTSDYLDDWIASLFPPSQDLNKGHFTV